MSRKQFNQKESASTSLSAMPDVYSTAVFDTPSDFNQMVTEKPNGASVNSLPTKLKLAAGDNVREIGRASIIGSYDLMVPIIDEAVATKQLAKLIDIMAENHQRQKLTAFWESYPNAVLLKPGESYPDRQILRKDYKLYDKRAANYIIRYYNWKCMHSAAAINIISTGRLAGNQKFQEIATNLRLSYINNSIKQNLSLWCDPKGVTNLMIDCAKYLIGKTQYGANFAVMPLFQTVVWGNSGCKSMTPSDLILPYGKTGSDAVSPCFDPDDATDDATIASLLVSRMGIVAAEALTPKNIHTFRNDEVSWFLRMPSPENGAVMYYQGSTDTEKITMSAASDGSEFDSSAAKIMSDPLSSTLWNNYYYLESMGKEWFPEMCNPESDMRCFAEMLGMFEPMKDVQEMYDAIRANKNIIASEFFDKMQYKKGNKPTTATIIKWVPPIGKRDEVEGFEDTFERFDTQVENIQEYLADSKAWPSLTPAVFGNTAGIFASNDYVEDPLVLNGLPAVGNEALSMQPRRAAMFGKYASIFDLACTRNLDNLHTAIEFFGIESSVALNFCSSNDGIVFNEDPSSIHVLRNPIYDNTDPYKCGVNIIVKKDSYSDSEIEKFYTNPNNFTGMDLNPSEYVNVLPVYKKDDSYHFAHTADSEYLKSKDMAFIFVGSGIYELPQFAMSHSHSTNLVYKANLPVTMEPSAVVSAMQSMLQVSGLRKEGKYIQPTIQGTEMTLGTGIRIEYFDSMYGPVALNGMTSSISDNSGVDLMSGAVPGFASDFKIKSITTFGRYTSLWDNERNASQFMPWLASIMFNPPCYNISDRSYYFIDSKDRAPILFMDSFDYVKTKLLHTIGEHFGIEDTIPFYSGKNIKAIVDSFDNTSPIGSGLTMETCNLIAKIREIFKKVSSVKKFANHSESHDKNNNSGYVFKNVESSFSTDRRGSDNTWSKVKDKSETSNNPSSPAKMKASVDDTIPKDISDTMNSQNFADASDAKIDASVNRKSKIPADPLASQV